MYVCIYVCICSISSHLLQNPFYTESFAKADYGTESGVIAMVSLTMLFFSEGLWNNFGILGYRMAMSVRAEWTAVGSWKTGALRDMPTMEDWLAKLQREAKTLLDPFIWYYGLRICSIKTFALLDNRCWLSGAEESAVVNRRPTLLRWHLLGNVSSESAHRSYGPDRAQALSDIGNFVYMVLTLEGWGHGFFLAFRGLLGPGSMWHETGDMKETLKGQYANLWKWILGFRPKEKSFLASLLFDSDGLSRWQITEFGPEEAKNLW